MKTLKMFFLIAILLISGCNNNSDQKSITESGNIETTNIILSSQSNGQVININYSEGDFLKKGDTLLIVDHELQKIKLAQAIAGKKAADAKLRLAVNGARKEDISIANEKLKQAKLKLDQANLDLVRMENIWNEKAITKKQFEDFKVNYDLIYSQHQTAKSSLTKIRNISRPEEIEQIRSNYENAKANVDLIKKQISDSHIISPIDALIVDKFIEIGELINRGSSTFKISDQSNVKLVVYINEQNLGRVKVGQKVEVTTDSFEDKVYPGNVINISPEAEFTPKNIQTKDERTKLVFAVKIKVPNLEFELKSGMPADAKILIEN